MGGKREGTHTLTHTVRVWVLVLPLGWTKTSPLSLSSSIHPSLHPSFLATPSSKRMKEEEREKEREKVREGERERVFDKGKKERRTESEGEREEGKCCIIHAVV